MRNKKTAFIANFVATFLLVLLGNYFTQAIKYGDESIQVENVISIFNFCLIFSFCCIIYLTIHIGVKNKNISDIHLFFKMNTLILAFAFLAISFYYLLSIRDAQAGLSILGSLIIFGAIGVSIFSAKRTLHKKIKKN